jgi:hypothetical protein
VAHTEPTTRGTHAGDNGWHTSNRLRVVYTMRSWVDHFQRLLTREGDAKKIPDAPLAEAMPKVVANLELVRPRIIIPLKRNLSPLLIEQFQKSGASVVDGPIETSVKKRKSLDSFRPRSWSLILEFGRLLIAESPTHPSRWSFVDPSAAHEYLAARIKSCL